MTELRLEALTKRFGPARAPVRALDGITLAVAAGEFLTVVGPSGSGKTTLLRAIAGLETVDSGRIWFGERDVTTLATRRRNVGLVFAHGALYAHRTVAQNLAYGPHVHGMRGAALALRTREVARALHVEDLLDRRPPQLSSGQAQRVALGRALANAPDVLLLDEPLARLDVPLRSEIRDELRRAHRRFETTTLCVTHDQSEAMALGDRLAVIAAGKVLQVGTPREVYAAPASLFVASFFGAPRPRRCAARSLPERLSANGYAAARARF